jgi:osmotically-inducible protein OsmY
MRPDPDLKSDVERELEWDPDIDASRVAVAAKDGVIALTGHVQSLNEKWEAEAAAMRVLGTLGVANDLQVDLPGMVQRSDPDIAEDALAALLYSLPEDADDVRIVVKNGWVTLEGDVRSDHVRRNAACAVRRVRGVKELINTIKVRVGPAILEIGEQIEEALKRSGLVSAEHIMVDVYGGEVLLEGTVRSWAARKEAEDVAWRAPGVSTVDNRITVQN